MTPVGSGVSNHLSLAVDRPVGGLHHQFGLAVAIQIIDDERHVVGTAADVPSQIDAPQTCAVHAVAVDERRSRESVVCIVVRIRGVPLQEYLVLSVAVRVAHARVVGAVGIGGSVGSDAIVGLVDGDGQIALGGIGLECERAVAPAAPHLIDGIGTRHGLFVDEEGGIGGRRLLQQLAVAVDAEGLLGRILFEQSPTERHLALLSPDGHHAASEPFTLDFGIVITGLGKRARQGSAAQHTDDAGTEYVLQIVPVHFVQVFCF